MRVDHMSGLQFATNNSKYLKKKYGHRPTMDSKHSAETKSLNESVLETIEISVFKRLYINASRVNDVKLVVKFSAKVVEMFCRMRLAITTV